MDAGDVPEINLVVNGWQERHAQRLLDSLLRQTNDAWSLVWFGAEGLEDFDAFRRLHLAGRVQLAPPVPSVEWSAALNSVVRKGLSTPYLSVLPADSHLEPHAVAELLEHIRIQPAEVEVVYTDSDVVDERGTRVRSDPLPDWSPQLLRGRPYISGLVAIRTQAFLAVGGYSEALEGEQLYDLLLRIAERRPSVAHLPLPLLHRADSEVPAADGLALRRRIVSEHHHRLALDAHFQDGTVPGDLSANLTPAVGSSVSIVIPTRGGRGVVRGSDRCLVEHAVRSIVQNTSFPSYELVVVHDSDADAAYLQALRSSAGSRLRVVEFDGEFNFSAKVNLGARHAKGDFLVLLNDDVEVMSPRWLEQLVGLAQEPDVGAVGAKLLFEDGSIQHAGVMMHGGQFQHVGFHMPDVIGLKGLNFVDREVSGVTAACMAIRRETWYEVGGMDESLPNNFNDVDLCWRLRRRGYRIVQANSAVLYHFESMTRKPRVADWERDRIFGRLGRELVTPDPYTFPEPGEAVSPGARSTREWMRVSAEVWRTEGNRAFYRKARARLLRR